MLIQNTFFIYILILAEHMAVQTRGIIACFRHWKSRITPSESSKLHSISLLMVKQIVFRTCISTFWKAAVNPYVSKYAPFKHEDQN